MKEKLSIEQLLKMSLKEQSAYLATLPKLEAHQMARALFDAAEDRSVTKLLDNLNSHAKPALAELLELTRKEQSAYLAILQEKRAVHPAHKLFKGETDETTRKLVDSLNKNAPTYR